MGSDISSVLNSAIGQFDQMFAVQTQMQEAAQQYEMKSTAKKMEFDAIKSGIERISSVGEAISQLTQQQSQQIAQ